MFGYMAIRQKAWRLGMWSGDGRILWWSGRLGLLDFGLYGLENEFGEVGVYVGMVD